jgi:hypothetical protein
MLVSHDYQINNIMEYKRSDYNKIFASESHIQNKFHKIWKTIIQKTGLELYISKDFNELKDLVIYDILDGNRSTVITNSDVGIEFENAYFVLNFIHTLKNLGVKNCYIMVHTSYNRKRGKDEFENILKKIQQSASIIKKYAIQNKIRCFCIYPNKDYEHKTILDEINNITSNGNFNVYFLFDYNEMWITNEYVQEMFSKLPDIDVHVRHTKFQVSGGWIPEKMSHSVFLYSQNGTLHSNWNSDDLVALVALSLLTKLLHKDEILNKVYYSKQEIDIRNKIREIELFNKIIKLRANPKKLFIVGSPYGVYQFYY